MQGAVREHLRAMEKCGVEAVPIKKAAQMDDICGLIIPGGESTTVGKLMARYGFMEEITGRAGEGMAVFGTCTGLILLAKKISGRNQPVLGLMHITVDRNAFGRQIDSFEADLEVSGLDKPFHAVFIRAPLIEETGPDVEVLCRMDGRIVMAREKKFLAAAFHPELTDDLRIHKMFLEMCGCPSPSPISDN